MRRFRQLLILFLSSLVMLAVVINSMVKTVAQEEIASNRELIYSYVQLDGRELFAVAAMAATNSQPNSRSLLPMNMRVKGYEQQLEKIISQSFDDQTLVVTVNNLDEQTALIVSDQQKLRPRVIGHVIKLDAQIHGLSVPALAQQWSQIIRSALRQAQQERQPAYVRRQVFNTGAILLGMMLLCGLFLLGQKRLKAQWSNLQLQQPTSAVNQEKSLDLSQINTLEPEQLIAVMEQKRIWSRQKNVNVLKRGLLQIGHVVVWLVGLTYILGLFPYTRHLQGWLFTKWELVGIILGTYAAIKTSVVVIDRILQGLIEDERETNLLSKRRKLRLTTFLHVLAGMISYALVLIGIFLSLAHLRIPIGPLLAGAGILGFTLTP